MQASARSLPAGLKPSFNVEVLALVADSVICTDEIGRILVFNKAAEQCFGYSAPSRKDLQRMRQRSVYALSDLN